MRGDIEVFVRTAEGDKVILTKRNLIVNSGMDLIAQAMVGNKFINGMYIAYSNASSPLNETTPLVDRTVDYYQTTASDNTKSFMRVPLAATPSLSSSDESTYNSNKATFIAISDNNAAVPISGNEVTAGVSKVYGAALCYLDPDDMANDIMYSSVLFADLVGILEEVTILAGAQVGVRWAQTWEQP